VSFKYDESEGDETMNHNNPSNGIKLSPVLSEEETVKYFEFLQAGNTTAREILIKHNLRLVLAIINENIYSTTVYDKDDLMSIGIVGLIKAVDSYKVGKSKFSTYAMTCIKNEIYISFRKKQINAISLNDPINTDERGAIITIVDTLYEADVVGENIEKQAEQEGIRRALNILSELERTVVELYYGFNDEPKTGREVAKIMGITQSYVSIIEIRARAKITKELQHQQLIEKNIEKNRSKTSQKCK